VQRHGIGQQVQRSSSGSTPHDRVTILQICSSRSLALDRPRQSALRYPAVRSNRASTYSVRRQPAPIHTPLRSRTTSAIAPSTISHSARGTQIPITHAATPTYPFPRFPCMGLFLSRSSPERQIFCPSSVSLFDLKARFFVPTRRFADVVARRSCQGWPPRQPCGMLRACQAYLDSFEHDGTLGAIGMTIRGEPAFGRGSVAPQPCIRWVQGPEP
jgi:hypothetical protein